MEEVEDDLGLRHLGLDGLDERGGHVDGDDLDLLCPLLPELVKEGVEGLGALALGGPDDSVRVVIDHGGDVAVAFAEAELIDADAYETVEPVWVELLGDDALDNVADGAPGDAHHPGDLGLVGDLSEVGGHLFKGPGEAAAWSSPGNHLDTDAAGGALHATRSVLDDEPDHADPEVDPADRIVTMVIAGSDLSAAGTSRLAPRRLHRKDDTDLLEVDTGDEKTGDPDQNSGKLGDAHGFLPAFGRFSKHQKALKTVRFSIFRGLYEENSDWKRLRRPRGGLGYPLSMQESLSSRLLLYLGRETAQPRHRSPSGFEL